MDQLDVIFLLLVIISLTCLQHILEGWETWHASFEQYCCLKAIPIQKCWRMCMARRQYALRKKEEQERKLHHCLQQVQSALLIQVGALEVHSYNLE